MLVYCFCKKDFSKIFCSIHDMQGIALAVGDWYFDRAGIKAIDCAYPCDKTCHNLIFRWAKSWSISSLYKVILSSNPYILNCHSKKLCNSKKIIEDNKKRRLLKWAISRPASLLHCCSNLLNLQYMSSILFYLHYSLVDGHRVEYANFPASIELLSRLSDWPVTTNGLYSIPLFD